MKRSFFQAAVVSILLYGCTIWTLTKRLEKKLDGNYTKWCEQYWTSIYIYIKVPDIGLAVRVFANGPGDLGSIPGRVIPKTQKMVLDASLLNTQHYKVRIKGKVEPSREGVAPSPTSWCSSYRKGSLRVTLDYGRQLYIYICVCVCVICFLEIYFISCLYSLYEFFIHLNG